MSLDVAIQSVVFYILSCSPCAAVNSRRKAKVQAKKDQKAKEELELRHPDFYAHPPPEMTNPYWSEDIGLGPMLAKKNADRNYNRNESQNPLSGSSYAGSTAQGTDAPSSPTAVTEGSRISGEGWNFKRYQREDEALWGIDFHGPGQKIREAIAKAGNSASRLLDSTIGRGDDRSGDESAGTYFMTRNPPVNDLHPPIVSSQLKREETAWMLQPPPSAKIMEGKERVVRSRADSNGSSRSRRIAEEPLSRQVTGKLMDAKLQSGEIFPDRPTSSKRLKTSAPSRPRAQRHDRNRSPSPCSSSEEESRIKKAKRPPPIAIPPGSGFESDDSINSPYLASHKSSTTRSTRALTTASSSRIVVTSSTTSADSMRRPEITRSKTAPTGSPAGSMTQIPLSKLSPNVKAMPASISRPDPKDPLGSNSVAPKSFASTSPLEVQEENAALDSITVTKT